MNPLIELIEEFAAYPDTRSRLAALLQMGKALAPVQDDVKSEAFKVPGCLSVVYIKGELVAGKMVYQGDADALLVKGLVAFLLEGMREMSPQEILAISPDLLQDSGLGQSLVPGRNNGFRTIFLKMQAEAQRVMDEADEM